MFDAQITLRKGPDTKRLYRQKIDSYWIVSVEGRSPMRFGVEQDAKARFQQIRLEYEASGYRVADEIDDAQRLTDVGKFA